MDASVLRLHHTKTYICVYIGYIYTVCAQSNGYVCKKYHKYFSTECKRNCDVSYLSDNIFQTKGIW